MTRASQMNPIVIRNRSRWIKALQLTSALLIGFFVQNSNAQQTVTLNFDNISNGTVLSNQYQSQGVSSISGAEVILAAYMGYPANSMANIVYSPDGLITVNIDSSILPNVKSASVYVSGPEHVGLYAFDANGNLVGEDSLAVQGTNVLLSVTSSGAPITQIQIHNGGATFAIDDLSLTSPPTVPPVPACRAAAEDIYNMIEALPKSSYNRPVFAPLDRLRLLLEIINIENLRAKGKASPKALAALLKVMQADVKYSIKSSQNQAILQKLSELGNLIQNNACQ